MLLVWYCGEYKYSASSSVTDRQGLVMKDAVSILYHYMDRENGETIKTLSYKISNTLSQNFYSFQSGEVLSNIGLDITAV